MYACNELYDVLHGHAGFCLVTLNLFVTHNIVNPNNCNNSL